MTFRSAAARVWDSIPTLSRNGAFVDFQIAKTDAYTKSLRSSVSPYSREIEAIVTSMRDAAEAPPALSVAGAIDNELVDVIQLEQAAEHLWRVCDRRIASGQGRCLAFIERKQDRFEVMQFADDFVWTIFTSMQDALAHVVRSYPDTLMAGRTSQEG